ncbi:MAG TPA: mechanosensitive ion channel family protein [Alkalispirochaeta sp.]|nr:mechanosensitive ion channel family protein [Alkalispirochaeta sp.]
MAISWINRTVAEISRPEWLPDWTVALALPVALIIAYSVLSRVIPVVTPKRSRDAVRLVFRRTRFPVQIMLLTATLQQTLVRTIESPEAIDVVNRAVPIIIIFGVAVLAYRLVGTFFLELRKRFDTTAEDNLKARRATTQIIVLERVVGFIVVVIGIAAGLMSIPGVRQYGASLLASAGVAGLVVGFAAQQTIANVLAGIQIAITQPLRIEDAVVIDGEWGWIEEITLTYVVVRVWDRRRLVVPISYLLQKPFQNWTRNSSSIMGSIYLYVDYTLNVDELRGEQSRLLAASQYWDGDVDVVQVVDTTERTMVVRSLVSASSSPRAWDLRCEIREGLVTWIKEHYPDSLPRERMRIKGTIQA